MKELNLSSIPLVATAAVPSASGARGSTASASSGDAFALLFARHWSGPLKPVAGGSADTSALSQLESLLGGMLQQPPPALTAIFDQVQSALGAPPVAGTHASIASLTSRIDALLGSGTTAARIQDTVSQAMAQAFSELSTTSPGMPVDPTFVARLRSSIAAALDVSASTATVTVSSTSAAIATSWTTATRWINATSSTNAHVETGLISKTQSGEADPPGIGPPVEQAAALAQRIAQVGVAIVAGADTGETGQQFRSLASALDPSGRGLPAPQTQTVGELGSPTVASSSPSASQDARSSAGAATATTVSEAPADAVASATAPATGTIPAAASAAAPVVRPPVLQLSAPSGEPVRIDAQLAPLISALAFARGGDTHDQRGNDGGQQLPSGTSAGSWLGVLGAHSPVNTDGSNAPVQAGAAPQTPPSNPFDRFQIVDQVTRALAVRPSDGTTTMRIHLVPDNLGDVSVKLVVGPNGVSASFTAATPAAGLALTRGAPQLGAAFADHGLQLQHFSVNVGADPQGGFAYRQPQSFYTPFTHNRGAGGSYDDEEPLAAIPSFGPPAAARPQGYLDYLV